MDGSVSLVNGETGAVLASERCVLRVEPRARAARCQGRVGSLRVVDAWQHAPVSSRTYTGMGGVDMGRSRTTGLPSSR